MKLIEQSERWCTYHADDDDESASLQFLVGRITYQDRRKAAKMASQAVRNLIRGGGRSGEQVREITVDYDRTAEANLLTAVLALRDSRNCELDADEQSLQVFRDALGRDVAIGEVVRLDGHWTEALKRHVLQELPGLALWVVQRHDSLELAASEELEGKGATS